MASIYVTREIPNRGIEMLKDAGHDVTVSDKDGVLSKEELVTQLQGKAYDAVLCLLTDTIDAEVFDAVPSAQIFANYAVGYNNIDVEAAKERGVTVTNTPGVLTETVAEHAFALILSVVRRIPEGDRFTRAGKYEGWGPQLLLGNSLAGRTLGILGAGRIGQQVAECAHRAFGTTIIYNDIQKNAELEESTGATFVSEVDGVFEQADIISVHVPLLESTRHLVSRERLAKMKTGAYLINTSRGPVIDEVALVEALQEKSIKGAGLDVFEFEPELSEGLAQLENVVLTPHIASATEETRQKMSELAAQNIIDKLAGETPAHVVGG